MRIYKKNTDKKNTDTITYKTTNQLFFDTYKFKISIMMGNSELAVFRRFANKIRVGSRMSVCIKNILSALHDMTDYEIRVHAPNVNIYTNNYKDISYIANLIDLNKYNFYISKPPDGVEMSPHFIYSTLPFDFKIHIDNSCRNQEFLSWSSTNENVRLTKSSKKILDENTRWWYPSTAYFYIKGEHNLLLAQMYLGSSIRKIEKMMLIEKKTSQDNLNTI